LFPWRETSSIVTLFTKDYGKVSGVAKGIKRAKPAMVPLERGQIVDTVIYTKHSRTLQTLTDLTLVDFFPLIRSDLEKTALRDIALELILKSIHDTDPHPEFYERARLYFSELEKSKGRANHFMLLWRYILDVVNLLGFAINLEKCVSCGRDDFSQTPGAYLVIAQGSIVCSSCSGTSVNRECFIPSLLLSAIKNSETKSSITAPSDLVRLTKLFISFCSVHIEITNEFKSMRFLEEILPG
jgi:DNA repair protein RecO (recombination protein O)